MRKKKQKLVKVLALSSELSARRSRARKLCMRLGNTLEDRHLIAAELFRSAGNNLEIWGNFFCEFGDNISIGENVFINHNCVILDMFEVRIGANSSIGPNVGIYTSNHSLIPEERLEYVEFGEKIVIEDNVWIGGHVVILPGVCIGEESVIAAGSVVTHNVPPRHKYIVKNKETIVSPL